MQITIQSLEITYNKTPYRFIVKKLFDTDNEKISFHCWADENTQAKYQVSDNVLTFEWDQQRDDFGRTTESPVSDHLKKAIRELFQMERA